MTWEEFAIESGREFEDWYAGIQDPEQFGPKVVLASAFVSGYLARHMRDGDAPGQADELLP